MLLITLAPALPGCLTIVTRMSRGDPKIDMYAGPYSGTVADLRGIGGSRAEEVFGSLADLYPMYFIDLPLSLVADTLILPLTLYEQLSGKNSEPSTPGPVK